MRISSPRRPFVERYICHSPGVSIRDKPWDLSRSRYSQIPSLARYPTLKLTSDHFGASLHRLTQNRRVLRSPLTESVDKVTLKHSRSNNQSTPTIRLQIAFNTAYVDTISSLISVRKGQFSLCRPRDMSYVVPSLDERGGDPTLMANPKQYESAFLPSDVETNIVTYPSCGTRLILWVEHHVRFVIVTEA